MPSVVAKLLHVVIASCCYGFAADAFAALHVPRPSAPRRLLILPDSRADLTNPSLWHHHLKVRMNRSALPLTLSFDPDRVGGEITSSSTLAPTHVSDDLLTHGGDLFPA